MPTIDFDTFDPDAYRADLIARGGTFARDWTLDQLRSWALSETMGPRVPRIDHMSDLRPGTARFLVKTDSADSLSFADMQALYLTRVIYDSRTFEVVSLGTYAEVYNDYGGESVRHGFEIYFRAVP